MTLPILVSSLGGADPLTLMAPISREIPLCELAGTIGSVCMSTRCVNIKKNSIGKYASTLRLRAPFLFSSRGEGGGPFFEVWSAQLAPQADSSQSRFTALICLFIEARVRAVCAGALVYESPRKSTEKPKKPLSSVEEPLPAPLFVARSIFCLIVITDDRTELCTFFVLTIPRHYQPSGRY
jgi:hypothetical protein